MLCCANSNRLGQFLKNSKITSKAAFGDTDGQKKESSHLPFMVQSGHGRSYV